MTHLRPIDTTALPAAELREQPGPMLQWLPVAQLRIDDRYQRPLEKRNWDAIRTIAANFDWCAFGPILCAPAEGGLFAVIDGQHRAHAAALCGIEHVPAMIVPVAPAQQALAFVKVNSGIRVSQHQTFRAELAADNPEARAIQLAAQSAGCEALTYNPNSATRKPRQLTCIGFLRRCIRQDQVSALVAGLQALVAFDQKGNPALYCEYIIAPLVAAIHTTKIYDPDTLRAALTASRNPFKTCETAETYAKANGISLATAKAEAFARLIKAAQVQA